MPRRPLTELSVAIVGTACRFPGASDPDEFWANLKDGIESIEILPTTGDADHVAAAGLLADVDSFDAPFFGMSPREAELTDPQQRLFLEVAWEALERAGYDPRQQDGSIGIFAGTGASSYLVERILPHRRRIRSAADAYQVIIGNNKDHLTTRTAFKLGLTGPAVTVQTACSTSLVAVHLAARSLLAGECDLALAGGVSLVLREHAGQGYERGGIVSPDGHCRAFDVDAAGTVLGSGAGIVVLKRYADAVRDNDCIHAVILGSAINNDGSAKPGYTAPSVEAQARAIRMAHLVSGVAPDSIGYVEAHGTGTPLGDPIELAALAQAFRAAARSDRFCGLGSVKSNIGHLDAAAGIAGLIKVVACLQHEQLPPTLHVHRPNPRLRLDTTPFYLVERLVDWPRADQPRRAGVSAFGIGGTNAHVIVEEAPPPQPPAPGRPSQLVSMSARSPAALEQAMDRLAMHLENHAGADLADVAFTLQVGRASLSCRRSFVCRDRQSAIEQIRQSLRSNPAAEPIDRADRPVVFLFPGQGSIHSGMAIDLYRHEATFRRAFDEASRDRREEILKSLEDRTLTTDLSQVAIFAIEYALATLWQEWGVRPRAVVGHSFGEYAAACIAGVWPVAEAARLVAERARLMQGLPAGAMISVPLGPPDIDRWIDDEVSLAAVNGESLSVLSGRVGAIARVEQQLADAGLRCTRLSVSRAFHSPMMAPIEPGLEAALRSASFGLSHIPWVSNVTGDWMPADAASPSYWLRQLREPVRFAQCMSRLAEREPDAVLLEVGPGDALIRLASLHPRLASMDRCASLPVSRGNTSEIECLLDALGRLWCRGVSVSWRGLYSGQHRRRIALPTYPFQRACYSFRGAADPAEETPAAEPEAIGTGGRLYAPVWREDIRSGAAPTSTDRRRWIVSGENDFAHACAAGLAELGEVVHVRTADDLFEPTLRTDVARDVVDLRHCGVESPFPSPTAGFDALTALVRTLGSRRSSGTRLAVVTRDAQDVLGDEQLRPERSMLMGAVLAASQEYSHLTCRAIDVTDATSARLLVEELQRPVDGGLVALRGTRRWVRQFEPIDVDASHRPGRLRRDGVYVILGGTGRIGLQIAEYLARTVGARLALISRRGWPPDDAARKALASIQSRNADLLVLSADIGDRAQLQVALDAVRNRFGAIHGVFHAAGTKSRILIDRLDAGAIDDLCRARVAGLMTLEQALGDAPLDFCLVFSSLATIVGGPGLAAYAAAHLFAESFVAERNRRATTTWTAVAWDNWLDADESMLASAAIGPDGHLTAAEGIEALERLLSTHVPTGSVVCSGDLQQRIDRARRRRVVGSREHAGLHPRPDLATPFAAPRTGLEERIAAIWRDALGIERIGVDDNFFALGGDSVVGIQILGRLGEIGIQLTPKQVFESQTIAALATVASQPAPLALPQEPVVGPVGLTPVQRRFFARGRARPERAALAVVLESDERLDAAAVARSIELLLGHHDMLRASFRRSPEDGWEQAVAGEVPTDAYSVHDLSHLGVDEQRMAIDRETSRIREQIDLPTGRVFGAALFQIDGGRSRLLIVVHHLVADGYSCLLIVKDFEALYGQLRRGGDARLLPRTTSYREWAERLREMAVSATVEGELDYWLGAASGEPLAIPGDEASLEQIGTASFQCSPELTARLLRFRNRSEDVSVDGALLAAIAEACGVETGQQSLLVDVDGHGREPLSPDVDVSRTVGWFTAPFPVAIRMAERGDSSTVVAAVTRAIRNVPSGGVGYGLLRYSSPNRDAATRLSQLPSPNIGFVYLGAIDRNLAGTSRLRIAADEMLNAGVAAGDLSHAIEIVSFVTDGRLTMSWSFDCGRLPQAMIDRIATETRRALSSIVERLEAVPAAAAGPDYVPERSSSFSPLVMMGPRTRVPPLFCVHPGGGTVLPYVEVARRTAPVQTMAALQCRGLAEEQPAFRSIEAMAADYIDVIQSIQPQGPYWLAGWSMGGTIAFEIARQLEARGDEVVRVVMFDTRPPGAFQDVADEDESHMIVGFALATLFYAGRRPTFDARDLARRAAPECWRVVLDELRGSGVLPPGVREDEARRLYEVWTNNLRAARRYEPASGVRAPLTIMRAEEPPPSELIAWLSEGAPDRGALDGWTKHSLAPIEWIDVPGSHYTMFNDSHAAPLADALAACLARGHARASTGA
jgi:non-ribosomal peptide synthase protein (TIGR01720 family)